MNDLEKLQDFEQKLKEKNWTPIFDEILEAVYKSDIGKNELKVFLFICRRTWGWGKDSEIIRVRDIVKELGFKKNRASEALSGLRNKHFVDNFGTNRYQIQIDTRKWQIKRKIKREKKDNFVPKNGTNRGHFVPKNGTSVPKNGTTKSEDSSKNPNPQSPRTTLKRKKRETTTRILNKGRKKPVVVSSLSSEKVKPKNQTLPPGLLEIILPKFNDTGWHTLTRETTIELILIAIEKGKKDIPNYFRYWKTEIDKKKNIRIGKPNYLITVVRQGNNPIRYEEELN